MQSLMVASPLLDDRWYWFRLWPLTFSIGSVDV
jgi:hypothetical protein